MVCSRSVMVSMLAAGDPVLQCHARPAACCQLGGVFLAIGSGPGGGVGVVVLLGPMPGYSLLTWHYE